MALVDYVSSSDEDDSRPDEHLHPSTSAPPLKRKRDDAGNLPPLPAKFHDLYASTTRVSTRDDPALHGGRTRAMPHVEGNWPTHLYIEWYPTPAEHDSLNSLLLSLKTTININEDAGVQVHSFLSSDLGAPLPLHISLSRPIGFLTGQKDDFLSSLTHQVNSSGVRPFTVAPRGLDWVPNFEKTRWFLVLRLSKPTGDHLNKLLKLCNQAVQDHGQMPLYQDDFNETHSSADTGNRKRKIVKDIGTKSDKRDFSEYFHISIGWTLDQPAAKCIEATRALGEDEVCLQILKLRISVPDIKVKIGNIVTSLQFPLKTAEGKGVHEF